ncbi:MAG TPA: polysaccharide deacetylase family protein [Saprospiraceae bacterium]|nr:polysaccharide deacetylase family protein [Saprospiraceae bacterium]
MLKDCLWELPKDQKVIYLTFDDGPTPEVTDWVLAILQIYNAKATFFSIGKNIVAHPKIYANILTSRHSVGNHTFDHLDGFQVSTKEYLDNINKASECIESNLFRPPYGRMTINQYLQVKKQNKIIMWDLLSGDFDPKMSAKKSIDTLISKAKDGSIITFHDSIKAKPLLQSILPEVLHYWHENGYTFEAIPMTK